MSVVYISAFAAGLKAPRPAEAPEGPTGGACTRYKPLGMHRACAAPPARASGGGKSLV